MNEVKVLCEGKFHVVDIYCLANDRMSYFGAQHNLYYSNQQELFKAYSFKQELKLKFRCSSINNDVSLSSISIQKKSKKRCQHFFFLKKKPWNKKKKVQLMMT